jgi:hypothetical protein
MPKSTRKAKGGRQSSRGNGSRRKSANGNGNGRGAKDAIALLKADHREVETMFSQFEKARSDDRKRELAQKICLALNAHTAIEEEIFYPAFLEATDETDIHHEAEVEHDGAKNLIAQIEATGPDDEYYDAKVTVLSEMIKHHVNEEEKRGGMFSKARQSDMDLKAIGEQLQTRKAEFMSESRSGSERDEVSGALLGRGGARMGREADKRE